MLICNKWSISEEGEDVDRLRKVVLKKRRGWLWKKDGNGREIVLKTILFKSNHDKEGK